MERKTFFRKYGVSIAALVIFAVLSCIFCLPSLQGKVIYAGDTAAYENEIHELKEYHEKTGEYSLWNNSLFCGMPTYQIGYTHYVSSKLLKPLTGVLVRGNTEEGAPFFLLLYFVCFYVLLRSFEIDRRISIAGAIAIGLSSYFILIIPAGHLTKASTIPLMSLAIGGFRLMFRKKYALGFILTVIPSSIALTRHLQMSYYIFMFIGLLFIAELYRHIKEKRYRDFFIATLIFTATVVLGLGTNSSSFFANREYLSETMRGGHSDLTTGADDASSEGLDIAYATEWSYGIDESLSFLIPGIKGGASSVDIGENSGLCKDLVSNGVSRKDAAEFCKQIPLYWGDQSFTAGNVYMGAVVCFLFVLGLIIVKGPYKWAIAVATLFSIMLAWGHNFMSMTEAFFRFMPLYNKFRAVSSILIVAEITMPLLGFMAIREIMNGNVSKEKVKKGIYISAGITAGICIFFALFGRLIFSFTGAGDAAFAQWPDFLKNGIINERKVLLTRDSLRSAMFIILSAATVWLFSDGKIKGAVTAAILGVLVLADMWPVDRRYFNENNYVNASQYRGQFEMKPYEKQILSDRDPHFRVLNATTSTFNDARTSRYFKSIGGYSAVKLRRYQDIIERHISRNNMNVINMLNAKYFIVEGENGQPTPLRNANAMGNAWFVDTLLIVDSATEESDALNSINLHTTAVTDREFASFAQNAVHGHDSLASVVLTEYTPRTLDYECSSTKGGTLVFSEVYYPYGWKAYIDGKPAEHFRVNYILRALNVPAGGHKIHFEFAPDSVRKGEPISAICIFTMYALILGCIVLGIIRLRRDSAVRK